MLNVGAGEIVIILIAALLILGPKRLPEMARIIGKFMREFRRQTDDVRTMVEREFYRMDEEVVKPLEDVHPERNLILPPDNGHDPAHDRPDHHAGELPAALDSSVATTQQQSPVQPAELEAAAAKAKTEPEPLPVVAPPPTAVSRERAKELAAVPAAPPAPKPVTAEPEKN